MRHRIKAPQREDLAKIFRDPRTLKAFELIFTVIPDEFGDQQATLEGIQALAESNAAQTALAMALLHAVQALTEVKALEPVHQCTCQFDDLSPRHESLPVDTPIPRYESIQTDHLEPTKIENHNISSLEII